MKVKCIKTVISKPDKSITNDDVTGYLKVGTIFWVYGIEFANNIVYVYVYGIENFEHLLQVPLELFEIIDNTIPEVWLFGIQKYGGVTLWPKMFYEKDFWENFTDHQKDERNRFESLRKIIEK